MASRGIKLFGDWAPISRSVASISWEGLSVFNLEGPVLDDITSHTAQDKAGPCLCHNSLPILQGKSVASLSNNHMMDFGRSGLAETQKHLVSLGFDYVGAGSNIEEANKPILVEHEGLKIAILSRCEEQFGTAGALRAGVATYDFDLFEQIRELKRQEVKVIVSVHAAAEMSSWPSPTRQKMYRALIDAGADVIHGHHSHVPQGWEKYKQGVIFYGLGNFCVDPDRWKSSNSLWSFSPEICWVNGLIEVKEGYLKVVEDGQKLRVTDLDHAEKKIAREYIKLANLPLSDSKLLLAVWQEHSVRMYGELYSEWLWYESYSSAGLSKRLKNSLKFLLYYLERLMPIPGQARMRSTQLLRFHLFACDSHCDAIKTALGIISRSADDYRGKSSKELLSSIGELEV